MGGWWRSEVTEFTLDELPRGWWWICKGGDSGGLDRGEERLHPKEWSELEKWFLPLAFLSLQRQTLSPKSSGYWGRSRVEKGGLMIKVENSSMSLDGESYFNMDKENSNGFGFEFESELSRSFGCVMGEVPVMEEEKIRREVRVLRYKEKRQSRLFSKKIIYQVRKLNADKRPRLKVKNNIVRAPCGVMDQMTSAYCEANQLLAMVCQYEQRLQNSIGGADYGSVRVGAFMGLKIIKSTANGMNPNELEDNCVEMLEARASLDYLCNVAPHSCGDANQKINKADPRVENNIVGAPCGVMDQMTSACGEANQLLAMVCQVYYGSVRVGAFMGLKIIMSIANGMNPDELEDNYVEMLEAEASLDYLCNVAPHRTKCNIEKSQNLEMEVYMEPRILVVEQFVSSERIVYGAPNKFFRPLMSSSWGSNAYGSLAFGDVGLDILQAEELVATSVACLVDSASNLGVELPQLSFNRQCSLLNITYCPPTEVDLSLGKKLPSAQPPVQPSAQPSQSFALLLVLLSPFTHSTTSSIASTTTGAALPASSTNKKRGIVTGKKTATIVRTSGKSRETYDLAISGPPKEVRSRPVSDISVLIKDRAPMLYPMFGDMPLLEQTILFDYLSEIYDINLADKAHGDAPFPMEFTYCPDQWEWLCNHFKAKAFQEAVQSMRTAEVEKIMADMPLIDEASNDTSPTSAPASPSVISYETEVSVLETAVGPSSGTRVRGLGSCYAKLLQKRGPSLQTDSGRFAKLEAKVAQFRAKQVAIEEKL
ncbi:hypothetical protein LguiB_018061 [Lonicera macranthoides]